MRGSRRSLPALLLLLACGPAGAVELDLGWDTRMVWDSNPLRTVDDEEPDFSVYGGPNLGLRERSRALDYVLNYRLRYEQYFDLASVNGFEHFANGQATWRIDPRSQLSFSESFSRTRGLGANFVEPVPGIDPVDVAGELQIRRSPTVRSLTRATYTRQLSPLWSFESSVDGQLYDYEDELRQDVLSLRGSSQLTRSLSRRLLVGFGGALTRQQFDDTSRSLESGTTIVEAYGLLTYLISPSLTLSLAGGPAWSEPDSEGDESVAPRHGVGQDAARVTRLINPALCGLPAPGVVPAGTVSFRSCQTQAGFYDLDGSGPNLPVFLPSALVPGAYAIDRNELSFDAVDVLGDAEEPDGGLTYFGRVALVKSWRTVEGELSYRRSASTSSGIGSTTLDVASAVLKWQPSRRRFRIDARATWSLQSQLNEQPIIDFLFAPTGSTVWVDAGGVIYETDPGGGATPVANAARVVGVRTLGLSDAGFDIETLLFDLRANRRMTEHLILTAQAGWWRQETQSEFSEARTVEDLRFQLGFTWAFDPIEL